MLWRVRGFVGRGTVATDNKLRDRQIRKSKLTCGASTMPQIFSWDQVKINLFLVGQSKSSIAV